MTAENFSLASLLPAIVSTRYNKKPTGSRGHISLRIDCRSNVIPRGPAITAHHQRTRPQCTILRPAWTRSDRCKPQRIKCEHEIQSEADEGIQKDKEGRNVGGRQFGLPGILQPSAELRFAQVHRFQRQAAGYRRKFVSAPNSLLSKSCFKDFPDGWNK